MKKWVPWISWEKEQVRERLNWENQKKKEKKLQRIREEVFWATRSIYIEPLASKLPFAFQEGSKSSKKKKT